MKPNRQRHYRKRSRALCLFGVFIGLLMSVSAWAQEPSVTEIEVSPSILAQQAGPQRLPLLDGNASSQGGDLVPRTRLQGNFPPELILPPPSEQTKRKADRFIPTTIDPELPLKLVLGRPKVLQLAETPTRIYTPSDEIIRTEIIDQASGREVAVTGLKVGTTTLIFWFKDASVPSGQTTVSYEVRVYADPLLARPTKDLQADLNQKFPNSSIELDEISDRLIVRGQAPDAIELSQILNILAGARGVRGVRNQIAPNPNVSPIAQVNFASPAETLAAEEAFEQANRILDPSVLARAGIINQMKVIGEQQVMLKVTVAEVNRSAARSIGLNFGVNNGDGLSVFQSLTGNLAGQGGGAGGGAGGGGGGNQGGANILASLDMGQVRLAIDALRRMNLSRTLAEPNLVAMNGQPADFQAGGQFPIPIISAGGVGNNLQGVAFVPFGVQLQFTPFIQDRDVIRLQMNAEVSTRDESLGTNIGGGSVAGLNSRNFSTTVQLRSGQTIAVAGLLQTNYGASTDRVPFWGDLPIIGATGGVNRTSSGEQELVILVTPHLVAPVDACDAPSVPGSDVHEPTDIEFFIANRLESRRSKDYRASVRTDYARQKHAEHCRVEQFMIGDIGPTDRCCPRPAPAPHRAVPHTPKSNLSNSILPSPSTNNGSLQSNFDEMLQGASDE